MSWIDRLQRKILSGRADANIRFDDLRLFLLRLGFVERARGSHHIFRKEGVRERLNLQRDQSHAKPYQVRQIRQVILKYRLEGEDELHKYEIIIYWSNEDGVYVAEAPELPGCTAHGDTQEAALEHIGQAVDLWLETAREFGDPIPAPKGERLMLA